LDRAELLLEVMINLIANTKTKTGLSVKVESDKREYPKGVKVLDAEFATINIVRDAFHGEWNYPISPRPILLHLYFYSPLAGEQRPMGHKHSLDFSPTNGMTERAPYIGRPLY
jgi:hypothetical protein